MASASSSSAVPVVSRTFWGECYRCKEVGHMARHCQSEGGRKRLREDGAPLQNTESHLLTKPWAPLKRVFHRLSLFTRAQHQIAWEIIPDEYEHPQQIDVGAKGVKLSDFTRMLDLEILGKASELRSDLTILLETHLFRGRQSIQDDMSVSLNSTSTMGIGDFYGRKLLYQIRDACEKSKKRLNVIVTCDVITKRRHDAHKLALESRLPWIREARNFLTHAELLVEECYVSTNADGIVPPEQVRAGNDSSWTRNRLLLRLDLNVDDKHIPCNHQNVQSTQRIRSVPQQSEMFDEDEIKMEKALVCVCWPFVEEDPTFSKVQQRIWRPLAKVAGLSADSVNQAILPDICGTETRGYFRFEVTLLTGEFDLLMVLSENAQLEGKKIPFFLVPWKVFEVPVSNELGRAVRLTPGRDHHARETPELLLTIKNRALEVLSPGPALSLWDRIWTMPSGVNTLWMWIPKTFEEQLKDAAYALRGYDRTKRLHVIEMTGRYLVPLPLSPFGPSDGETDRGSATRDPCLAVALFDCRRQLEDIHVQRALCGVPIDDRGWERTTMTGGAVGVRFHFRTEADAKAWFEASWEFQPSLYVTLRHIGLSNTRQQEWRKQKFYRLEEQTLLVRSARKKTQQDFES